MYGPYPYVREEGRKELSAGKEREALQQHHTDVSTSRVLRWMMMMMTKMGHLTEGTKGHQPPPPAKPRSSLFITAEKEGEVFETIGGKRTERFADSVWIICGREKSLLSLKRLYNDFINLCYS